MRTLVLAAALALLGALSAPQGARADSVTVVLTNGGQAQGELIEYAPGDHLTISQANGQQLRIGQQQIVSMQMGPSSAGAGAPPAAYQGQPPAYQGQAPIYQGEGQAPAQYPGSAPPYQGAPAPYGAQPYGAGPQAGNSALAQPLLLERQRWLSINTSLAAPITLLVVGAALIVTGTILINDATCYDDYGSSGSCDNGETLTGALLDVAGAATMVVGGVLLPIRIVRRIRRTHTLRRIDDQLRSLGVQASVAPWLGRGSLASGPSPSGSTLGLRATLRF